ncbi:hypothetical protein [Epilithonimonas sp.]|uniref:hypothetical protein n=1 Tax=Epilithonimonas sp. TaxID=2894511 RepID=UPI002897A091|nr:hypothetical protein [Epilithonimonas sp.]
MKTKLLFTLLTLFLTIVTATAQTTNCNQPIEMGALCSCVSDRRQDTREDSLYEYEFEERINKLACVDITKDSPEVINKKIHDWWIKNEGKVICSGLSFNVSGGNLLKLASYTAFTAVLDKAVYDWKVPLNTVDKSDGRTTLDYIKDEIIKSKGQPKESVLKSYYDLLRKAGAKHRNEL